MDLRAPRLLSAPCPSLVAPGANAGCRAPGPRRWRTEAARDHAAPDHEAHLKTASRARPATETWPRRRSSISIAISAPPARVRRQELRQKAPSPSLSSASGPPIEGAVHWVMGSVADRSASNP